MSLTGPDGPPPAVGDQPTGAQPAVGQPTGAQPAVGQPTGAQPAVGQPTGAQPVDQQPGDQQREWQRFHPLTPLLRGGVVALGVLGYVISGQLNRIFGADPDDPTQGHWGIAAVVLAVVVLGVIGFSAIAWRAASYRLGTTTVELRTGVVAKQHRQVRYDRIQAVDISRPLLAQLFGLSSVRVEAAGGSDSNIELAYLPKGEADALRADLTRRAGQAPSPTENGTQDTEEAPATPERLIAAIPAGRVWLATAMSFNSAVLIVTIPLLLGALVTGNLGLVPVVGPIALGSAGAQFGRLSSWMNFRVEAGSQAIRVRHGLTEQRTSTIPLHRIQAVEISQPALWRALEWWRIRVNVAGVHGEPGKQEDALIPVGTREEVLTILAAMGPRWSLPEVVEGLDAPGPSPSFVGVPPAARWLDPLSWKRIGYAETPTALLSRGGWLGRNVTLVPYARMQSLVLEQGPIERRLGLAGVRPISTHGSVRPAVRHLSLASANTLLVATADRARAARRAEADPTLVVEPTEPTSPQTPTAEQPALPFRDHGVDLSAPTSGQQDGETA